jgi:hypothetical protein
MTISTDAGVLTSDASFGGETVIANAIVSATSTSAATSIWTYFF